MSLISIQTEYNQNYLVVDFSQIGRFMRNVVKQLLRLLFFFFREITSALNIITNNHIELGLLMSLGLGVGIGIAIFSAPDFTQAAPTQHQSPATQKLLAVETNLLFFPIQQPDSNSSSSGRSEKKLEMPSFSPTALNGMSAVLLKADVDTTKYLHMLQLGETLTLQLNNQGIKKVQVVEIKQIAKDQIQQLLPQTRPTLILYGPTGYFSDYYLAVIAR